MDKQRNRKYNNRTHHFKRILYIGEIELDDIQYMGLIANAVHLESDDKFAGEWLNMEKGGDKHEGTEA